jgi:diacylglycerol kinase family enzyme
MRLLLITNPSAGENGFETQDLIGLLAAEGHDVVEQSVKEEGWEDALRRDADLVVVAGGDGTVAEVFKELAGRGKVATIMPTGTANNIATSLGYRDDDDPRVLIRGWRGAVRCRCDVGSISSRAERLAFVESAGGGIFANVLARADPIEPDPDGEGQDRARSEPLA